MIYFLPGLRSIPTDVEKQPYGYLFDTDLPKTTRAMEHGGPGDSMGLLLRFGGEGALAYDAGSQEWVNAGGYWIGHTPNEVVVPDTWRRHRRVNGKDLTLADGNVWHVPVARMAPQTLVCNVDGEWTSRPQAQYAGLLDLAQRIARAMSATDGNSITIANAADLAVEALAWNYRVTKWEVGMLGLLDTTNIIDVLLTLIDWEAVVESGKKAESGTPA